ncbi:MAG: hypothetical protein EOO28_05065 [Comamonadaceae bacterium]|nr:MAG: hypothetical protein EOO28_05065 [Comamonadaceae bacterium]
MKRCKPPLAAALLTAAAALAATASLPVAGQTIFATTSETRPVARVLPKAAKRADMVVIDAARVTLDDKAERLAPGARIRGADNQLVFATQLVNQSIDVKYLRSTGGMVQQVWILNSEEAKEDRKNGLLDKLGQLLGIEPTPEDRDRRPYAELPGYDNAPVQRSNRVYTDLPAYDNKAGYGNRPAYGDRADKVRPAYNDLPAYSDLPAPAR